MKRQRHQMSTLSDTEAALQALEDSIEALSVSGASSSRDLLCRDEYVKVVSDFLSSPLEKSLQIFGMPGTGKTATVRYALSQIGTLLPTTPSAVLLNGYVIQKSTDIYWTLYSHFTKTRGGLPKKVSADQCATHIEKRFTQGWSKRTPLCVIVMDEMDKILEKHPKCVFRIIDWLTLPHANCKLITVSNTMELRSDAKTRSRIDNTRDLVFLPYDAKQLKEIFSSRVRGITPPPFSEQSIGFLCLQIASHNGDVRRLLQTACTVVCSVMMEIKSNPRYHYNALDGVITVKSVHGVVRQIFHDRFVEFIRSINSAVLFAVVALAAKRTSELFKQQDVELFINVERFFLYFTQVCEQSGIKCELTRVSFYEVLDTLREVGLIDVTEGADKVPVRNDQWTCNFHDDYAFSLLQPYQSVLDSCKLHPSYGKRALELLL